MTHFTPETDPTLFRCSCGREECDAPPPTSIMLHTLEVMRDLYGEPITVDSGPRCAFWNRHEGGAKDSEHLTGQGADLACDTSSARLGMFLAAYRAGFRRLGIGKSFLHVGVGGAPHAQDVAWTYYQ